jgi:hypothetical protein
MAFFKQCEGQAAVVIHNGVYRQCDVYTRDGYLYAKVGTGFVRIMQDGSTTKSKMRLDFLTWDGPLMHDGLGRLCTEEVKSFARASGAQPAALAWRCAGERIMDERTYRRMVWGCRCGHVARSAVSEARHRHNFPMLCRKPKLLKAKKEKPNV